jgi:hypothetical protein
MINFNVKVGPGAARRTLPMIPDAAAGLSSGQVGFLLT